MALIVSQKINNINKKNNIMESINALDCVEIKSFNLNCTVDNVNFKATFYNKDGSLMSNKYIFFRIFIYKHITIFVFFS